MWNKYGARRTVIDGHNFASKKEAKRYSELKILQDAGEISGLKLQPRFKLELNEVKLCTYVGDFAYIENGKMIIEDVKGCKNNVPYRLFTIKRLLMEAIYGIKIKEI